jgi:hypothetical protein
VLVSLTGNGRLLNSFCISTGNDILLILGKQLSDGHRDKDEMFPMLMLDTVLRLGVHVAEVEETIDEGGEVSRDVIGAMLRTVCRDPPDAPLASARGDPSAVARVHQEL